MITGKTVLAAVGFMFIVFIIAAILGTLVELIDEWRSNK